MQKSTLNKNPFTLEQKNHKQQNGYPSVFERWETSIAILLRYPPVLIEMRETSDSSGKIRFVIDITFLGVNVLFSFSCYNY